MISRFEYLVHTLSRTKRKNYENYVVNRIWNLLNDTELKPVTQQYVKRPEGGYAYIDLYFPQLNIGIECDELHHLSQAEEDELRFQDINGAICGYKEIRIPIFNNDKPILDKDGKETGKYEYLSLEEINKSIDEAVKRIQDKKAKMKNFKPWSDEPDVNKALERGKITVKDDYIFDQLDVRHFFGRENTSQLSYYKIKDNGDHLWIPNLAIEKDGRYAAPRKGLEYLNILSKDGKTIYESIKDEEGIKIVKKGEPFRRIVFTKYKDSVLNITFMKFAGVFQRDAEIIYLDVDGRPAPFCVHHFVDDEVYPD